MLRVLVVVALCAALVTPAGAQDTWRSFAASVPIGSTVKVRLTDGRRFNAVVVDVRADALLLQPKTRQPVPVQPLPYAAIGSLERVESDGGLSAGKAVAIGAATGAGIFLGLLVAMVSALD